MLVIGYPQKVADYIIFIFFSSSIVNIYEGNVKARWGFHYLPNNGITQNKCTHNLEVFELHIQCKNLNKILDNRKVECSVAIAIVRKLSICEMEI